MNGSDRIALVAVGGNSLIVSKEKSSIPDQFEAASTTVRHIAGMIEAGWKVVITHGSGPQVGFILRRSEIAIREVNPEEAAPVLKLYVTRVPITRPYFDVKPESDLPAFRAEAPRHPVFAIVG